MHRSVTEIRRSRSGLPKTSQNLLHPEQRSVWTGPSTPTVHRLTTTVAPLNRPVMPVLIALVAVTAVWGLTFVQVKDAVALYPLLPFLALRFAIATLALAAPGCAPRARARTARRGRRRGRRRAAGRGYTLQTLGLERTSVSSAGFVTGHVRRADAAARPRLLPDPGGRGWTWVGVGLATAGLGLLAGVHTGALGGNLLVLGGAAVYSLQIVLIERSARRYDALAFTLVELFAAFAVLALAALPTLEVPHGWTVWGALLVTGVFASALGFLVQTWAQQRTSATRTALVFTLEPVWAALFGVTLAGDRLGRARLDRLSRDHVRDRPRRARGRRRARPARPRAALGMTAAGRSR